METNQLINSDSLLSAVFNSAIDGIIIINERAIIKLVNPAASALFGYTAAEMVGNNVKMLMDNPHHHQHDGYLHNYIYTGIKKIIGIGREVEGKRKDGTSFPFNLSISEAFVGGERYFAGVVHDISEIKSYQTELLNMNTNLEKLVDKRTEELSNTVNKLLNTTKKLETTKQDLQVSLDKEIELGELKSKFVSLASHEFRTPLSTVLSSASIIEKYGCSDKQLRHTKKIKSSVKNLTNILNDFLSIGRLEEGKTIKKPETFDLIELLNDLIEEFIEIKKSGQHFEIEFAKNKYELHTDINLLRNILINLISNACKYSNENDLIKIIVEKVEDSVQLSVIDNGIGIPEKEQKFLFERFFRAENTGNIQGTGLGLNIVKNYIELLNGTISFTSEFQKGTTFTIMFPEKLNM